MPCPTAPALPLGQVAVACQVMCSRATPKYFINIFYRNILLQYFITLFYHNILSQYFRSSLRCYLTRPRRPRVAANPAVALLWGFKPGFRSERGLCNPPCEAFVFPSLLPTKYLEPADRSRLEKGKKAKKSSGPWHFHQKKKQQNKLMQLPESGLQRGWNPLLATRESTSLGDRRLPAARLALSRSVGGRWLQLQPGLPSFK